MKTEPLETDDQPLRRGASIAIWLLLYVLVMGAAVAGLCLARDRVVATLGSPEALAEWRQWAAKTQAPAGEGEPVERRAVKSDEPPALVLMRDHFSAIVMVTLVIGSFLFLFLMFVARGVQASSPRPALAEPGSRH